MAARKRLHTTMFLVVLACILMAIVEIVIQPAYMVKSLIKFMLFLLIPVGYSFYDDQFSFRKMFAFSRKSLLQSIILGIGVYVFILAAYFLLGRYFDFSNVTASLDNSVGVSKKNFLFVALYISFINSFLEELFFRGFAFLHFRHLVDRKVAYLFSGAVFSLYHVSIMTNWFEPVLFVLLIVSLFLAALLFNWLDEKKELLYPSWMVHMCANFSINTIGFFLFGII